MGEHTILAIGLIVGLLFGLTGISTLFNLMNQALTETQQQLTKIGAVSTLVLFVIAIVLIVKIRVISSLIIGAIIGAILNTILEMNGIHITEIVYNLVLRNLGL